MEKVMQKLKIGDLVQIQSHDWKPTLCVVTGFEMIASIRRVQVFEIETERALWIQHKHLKKLSK
jgi:hypothetical protein